MSMAFKNGNKESLSNLYKNRKKLVRKIKDLEDDIKKEVDDSTIDQLTKRLKEYQERFLEIDERIDDLIPD